MEPGQTSVESSDQARGFGVMDTDPSVTVTLGDGTELTWFVGSEADAIAEQLTDTYGEPDGVKEDSP